MKTKFDKWFVWLAWIAGVFVSLAVGGSFIDGKFLETIILSIFPEIVHTIVGWVIIAATVLGAVFHLGGK